MRQRLHAPFHGLGSSLRLMLRWLIMGVTDYRDVTVAQYNADYGVDLLMYDGYRVGPERFPNPGDRRLPRKPMRPR
jgi:hypothetical protein